MSGTTRHSRLAALGIALMLTACGGGGTSASSTTTSVASTNAAGSQAFIAFARSADFGSKDFASATDDELLAVGQIPCVMLEAGATFDSAVQVLVEADTQPTAAEAEALASQAVMNLCPQHASQLPK